MDPRDFPSLLALYRDLKRFAEPEVRLASAAPSAPAVVRGRDMARVDWPGAGSFWLTRPQAKVVDELLDAMMGSRDPDVDQGHLVAASGERAARLAEVFGGSKAWGTLVVPGGRPGTYRLAELPPPPDDAA